MSHDDVVAPTDWEDFEDFCRDLWRLKWGDENARKHGRRGQKQRGVDVYGQTADGRWHGVQCKVKSQILGSRLTEDEIDEEVEDARTFEPPLASLTIATTQPSDVNVERFIRLVSTRQQEEKSFPVHYRSWQDLLEECRELPAGLDLLKQHRGHWLDAGPPQVDISKLPVSGKYLFGRANPLQWLDEAWEDEKVRVVSIVAFGGIGKTALVGRWLNRMRDDGWRGAKRVFAWTFYSQGASEDSMASAEPFFDAVYRWLGVEMPKDARERGLELARLLRRKKALLYLDGIEPLQHPPGSDRKGQLRDPGLRALLRSWATDGNGLCVVTTRQELADLQDTGAPELQLDELSPDSALELLKALETPGADRDLRAAAEKFGHHALALNLLGNYLHGADIDAARIDEIDFGKAVRRQGGHAFRVMHAYAKWLRPSELQVLRLIGLFDRPATGDAIEALRREPAIEGLTDELVGLADEDWNWSVNALRDAGLLAGKDDEDQQALDAHPLVREYFGDRLQKENEGAWRAGHDRLYEHYRQKPEEELPDDFEGLAPLYAAVVHGCRAGRVREVFTEVYRKRIHRRNAVYSQRQLGAFGADLTAVTAFFEHPWDRPSAQLSESSRAWLLNEAGFVLRALGRLAEAVEPMRATLELNKSTEQWTNAAVVASNLSELTLTLGAVAEAVAAGEESVELADRSGDDHQRLSKRARLAEALHQAGRREESATAFREAEALQAEWQPHYPRLYSLQGYLYCNLLLGVAEPEDGAGLDGVAGAVGER